jgi:hypothetical protein
MASLSYCLFNNNYRATFGCMFSVFGAKIPAVENEIELLCPYCGQVSTLVIDTIVSSQRFTTDCEVCCRPFGVAIECEAGEILSADVLNE